MTDRTDALIRDAIREEESPLAAVPWDGEPLTETILQSFRGRRRWLSIFPFLLSVAYSGLALWCVYQFFQADATKLQIAWATGFVVMAVAVGLIKVWLWGEWQRNSLVREIKRLELAILDLRDRVGS